MTPRVGSLFAGYGGLDLAVEEVFGGEMAWYSEIDKGALKILKYRFPGIANVGSVTEADWSQVEPVEILTGGSPCQDLSTAGGRAGMTEGTRSNLWVAMREAIAELRPKYVIWENVRGAYSAAADSAVEPCPGCVGDGPGVHLRALGRVLGDLSELGYDAQWHGLRAADVGGAHGRFRVFVIATDANRQGRGGIGWLEPIGRDAHGRGGADGSRPATEPATLLPTPAVNDMGEGKTVDRWDEWTADMQAKHGNGNGHGKSLAIEAQRLLPTPTTTQRGPDANQGARPDAGPNLHNSVQLLQTPSVADALGGHERRGGARGGELLLNGQAKEMHGARWGDYDAAIARWESVIGRPAPEPTQTSTKGNPQLSAAFVEWLMGLPAGWVTDVPGITRNESLKALGNGVVWQQAAEALRVMVARMEMAA